MMNKKKPYVYKRIIAYIIDLIIVTLISGMLSIVLTNNEKYNQDSEKLIELTKKVTSSEIDTEEYYREFDELNYDLTKDSVDVTIITIGVSIVYFVVFSYFCNGITLGKYIVKLRIVSNNGKALNILNYFLRSLVIDLILSHTTSVILINLWSKEVFIKYYSKVSNVFTVLLLISFIIIMYRNDGRGIEDFMGNTRIVNMKDLEIQDDRKEAIVVKEKK